MHRWDGPIFRGRFRSERIEDESYFDYVLAYIHLNPVRARLVNRADDDAWTSHRAYLGLECKAPWLRIDEMLGIFGSSGELDDFVRSLHSGETAWPTDFLLDGERLVQAATQPSAATPRPTRLIEAARDPEAVIDDVAELAEVSTLHLLEPVRGRGGNAARRFAVWALRRSTDLTLAAIGVRLKMSLQSAAKSDERVEREVTGRIVGWKAAWLARIDG